MSSAREFVGRISHEPIELLPILPAWPEMFVRDAVDGLVWLAEKGYGFLRVTDSPYDDAYFEKYRVMAATEQGGRIAAARVDLLLRHRGWRGVTDVGIGCGQFVEAMRGNGVAVYGYDINPTGVAWLKERGIFRDPYTTPADALTFWDALEHIPDVHRMIANARHFVFCSLPIFTGPEHVLRSKHFRRDEHCFYFTRNGLIGWMRAQGFECVEHGTPESLLAREDIETFAFERVR